MKKKARKTAKKSTTKKQPVKRKATKKSASKKRAPAKSKTVRSAPRAMKAAKPIGRVTHFYNHIGVAIVKFSVPVSAGTGLRYKGATTDFTDTAKSMQFDHKEIKKAPKGKQVGIKVRKRVREGDEVYKIQ